jgi:hypothetical protein
MAVITTLQSDDCLQLFEAYTWGVLPHSRAAPAVPSFLSGLHHPTSLMAKSPVFAVTA